MASLHDFFSQILITVRMFSFTVSLPQPLSGAYELSDTSDFTR